MTSLFNQPSEHHRQQARRQAESAKERGMALAASGRERLTLAGELALLQAIVANPNNQATMDDATDHMTERYADGGRWRGSIPRSLRMRGLIHKAGYTESERASRHRGTVAVWEAANLPAIHARIAELRPLVAAMGEGVSDG